MGPGLIHLWHENQAERGSGAEHNERRDDDEAGVLLLVENRLEQVLRCFCDQFQSEGTNNSQSVLFKQN